MRKNPGREKRARAFVLVACVLALVTGCGSGDKEQHGAQNAEAELPTGPTGILEPLASFEKINLDFHEMEDGWFWSGERLYYPDRRWEGPAGEMIPTGMIICTATDGTSRETLCEREGWLFYHLFEGMEGEIWAFAGDWSENPRRYYLIGMDQQGQELSRFPVDAQEITAAAGIACEDAGMDTEGNIAMLGRISKKEGYDGYCLYLFLADGSYVGRLELEFEAPKLLAAGEEGLYLYDDAGRRPLLVQVDFETVSLGEAKEIPVSEILPGKDIFASYDVFADREKGILISETYGLYQYDPGTGELEKLLSWESPEVNVEGELIGQVRFGEVVGTAEDGRPCQNLNALYNTGRWSEGDPELVRVSYVDQADLPRRRTLVLGTQARNGRLSDMVRRFNRSNQQYRVILREYDTETMLDELIRAKEDVPDLLDLTLLDRTVLANKGLLEDLEPYFAGSEVVKKEDILPAVWEAGILDGKMRECVVSFSITTLWCSDTELPRDGWGTEELAALTGRHPGTPLSDYADAQDYLISWIVGMGADLFVDLEAGICSFDSPEFIELLKQWKKPAGLPVLSGQVSGAQSSFLDQEYLFFEGYYYGPQTFAKERADFSGKAVNAGYPFSGEDCFLMNVGQRYGIFGLSEMKDGAWAFLEYLLAEENQLWFEREFRGFPVRRDALDIYMDQNFGSVAGVTYLKPKGMAEAKKELRDMIDHLRPESRLATTEIGKILSEEIPYCWEGGKSAEEAAAAIQSRVQMYLKERS